MQRPSQDSRIDLAELKVHIVKKVGGERSRRYFYYLGRFLNQKLTKSEFDMSCNRLLGRENLALHNKLIRSMLRNASLAKSPPAVHKTGQPEKSLMLGKEDGSDQSGSLYPNCGRNDPVWSNGVLTKVRTMRDMPSRLGPNGKVESVLHQQLFREDGSGNRNTENGDLGPLAYQRSGRYADERGSTFCPAERTRIPVNGQVVAPVNSGDEGLEERGRLIISTGSVTAPLGIPFCSASVGGGTLRAVPVARGTDFISCYDSGGLLDTEMLRKRIENIAAAQGLGGVSAECSSMLNNILDVYLKKLIKSCVDLTGDRSMNRMLGKQSLDKQHSVSLLDFRVAMELNPYQLGQDWPLLRERISMHSFEEREEV